MSKTYTTTIGILKRLIDQEKDSIIEYKSFAHRHSQPLDKDAVRFRKGRISEFKKAIKLLKSNQ